MSSWLRSLWRSQRFVPKRMPYWLVQTRFDMLRMQFKLFRLRRLSWHLHKLLREFKFTALSWKLVLIWMSIQIWVWSRSLLSLRGALWYMLNFTTDLYKLYGTERIRFPLGPHLRRAMSKRCLLKRSNIQVRRMSCWLLYMWSWWLKNLSTVRAQSHAIDRWRGSDYVYQWLSTWLLC